MNEPLSVDDVITIDEVGMTFARHGDFVFKAAYQPIYRLDQAVLQPWGVEGSVRAIRIAAARQRTEAALPIIQDSQFAQLSLALQLRNFRDLHDETLRLVVNLDLEAAEDEADARALLRFVSVELLRADLDPRRIVTVLRDGGETDLLASVIQNLRRERITPALEGFGSRHVVADDVVPGCGSFVRFDSRWLHRVCTNPAALRLLALLVERMREGGIEPIATGIEDVGSLDAMMKAGLALFQGNLLARPALAGTVAELRSLSLDRLKTGAAPSQPFGPRR